MAPAVDYLFLSIETLVNTLSLIVMVPCMLTVLRTQGIHDNCKLLLIISAVVNTLILLAQNALFAFNFITENLMSDPIGGQFPAHEKPFLMVQNTLATMSSYISFVLVLERTFAVWHAAEYEQSCRHLLALTSLITGCLAISMIMVYAIHWHNMIYFTISVNYAVEASTLIISFAIIFYARRKLHRIPFDDDRLKAMYQVREVLNFSLAILPSVVVSSVMHTLSLVPTMLWQAGMITYPVCCLAYFTVHSLNCIFTKLVLIGCHKGMRQRFQLLFFKSISNATIPPVIRDAEKETRAYFDHMRAAWDSVPVKAERKRRKWKVYKAVKSISVMHLSVWLISIFLVSVNGLPKMDPTQLAHYTELNVIDLLGAIAFNEQHEGQFSYLIYCQFAYCHGYKDMDCNQVCMEFGAKVDKHSYGERMAKLSGRIGVHQKVGDCIKVCESDCGKNTCYRVCEALCEKHFSFPVEARIQHELDLNNFIGALREAKNAE